MNNIKILKKGIDVSKVLDQLEQYSDDWYIQRKGTDTLLERGYADIEVGNLQLMPIHYPGWVIRLYHDIRSDDPVMQVHFVFESSYQNRNYQFTCWCL